jgi:hypothetical protein
MLKKGFDSSSLIKSSKLCCSHRSSSFVKSSKLSLIVWACLISIHKSSDDSDEESSSSILFNSSVIQLFIPSGISFFCKLSKFSCSQICSSKVKSSCSSGLARARASSSSNVCWIINSSSLLLIIKTSTSISSSLKAS